MNNANERHCCGDSFFTRKHGSENNLTNTSIPVTQLKLANAGIVGRSLEVWPKTAILNGPLKRTKCKTERTIRYFQIDVFIFKDLQKKNKNKNKNSNTVTK